jgi:undecaprenyl-diphosphatase
VRPARCNAILAATVLAGGLAVWLLELAVGAGPASGLDREAFRIGADLRAAGAVSAVKVVTALGSSPAMGVLVAGAVLWLARARRALAAAALGTGAALTFGAVHVIKAAVDRPRPPGELTSTTLASFPSGHAAYATGLVAIAIALRLRGALLAAVVALAALVGLSRVYLRAHYLTDVLAGWALGAAAFAAGALACALVVHMRHNPRGK